MGPKNNVERTQIDWFQQGLHRSPRRPSRRLASVEVEVESQRCVSWMIFFFSEGQKSVGRYKVVEYTGIHRSSIKILKEDVYDLRVGRQTGRSESQQS